MAGTGNNYQIDMCSGALFGKIVLFAVPLMLSGILQLLFNAADLIVIGSFAPHEAIAAVGSTGSLTALIITVFIGLSIGTNVLVANYYGAKDRRNVSRTVHTAILTAIIGGIFLAGAGTVLARPLLTLMATPDNVLEKACLYMWIYFAGMPFIMLYNFGSAILRAVGDTRRPLYFLLFAGIINIGLNLFFVLVFRMDVAGVALATVISQGVAACLVLRCLRQARDACRLRLRNLRINPLILKRMLWIGLPAGIQGVFFSVSNIIIQSSINSFGSLAMAGVTAAVSLEGFIYICCASSLHQTVVSFVGQNLGGGKYNRVRRSILICIGCAIVVSLAMGLGFLLFGRPLLSIYNSDQNVIDWGMRRMKIFFTTYYLNAMQDVESGAMRGLGHSLTPAVNTLLGVCVLRVVWVCTVFPLHHTMENLMLSYPITWAVATGVNALFLYWLCRRLPRTDGEAGETA